MYKITGNGQAILKKIGGYEVIGVEKVEPLSNSGVDMLGGKVSL